MPDLLLLERPANGVLTVTLNRPDRLNALSAELMDELHQLWLGLRDDAEVRAIVVTGAGRAFCSGADAGMLAGSRTARGDSVHDELDFLPGRILAAPVIVAVNGACAGGGLHFVADADFAIASSTAYFVDPHVSVGQVSGIEPASLALRLPLPVIARLALLGSQERLAAQRAYELGMITEVVEGDKLLERATSLAAAIADASPEAVRQTRSLLRKFEGSVVDEAVTLGWAGVQAHWPHPDATEGPRAFMERRRPRWAGTEPR